MYMYYMIIIILKNISCANTFRCWFRSYFWMSYGLLCSKPISKRGSIQLCCIRICSYWSFSTLLLDGFFYDFIQLKLLQHQIAGIKIKDSQDVGAFFVVTFLSLLILYLFKFYERKKHSILKKGLLFPVNSSNLFVRKNWLIKACGTVCFFFYKSFYLNQQNIF